jgi:hypothetical protein
MMKSIIVGEEKLNSDSVYPRLMKYTGSPSKQGLDNFVILETSPGTGMVVWAASESNHKLGAYGDRWTTISIGGGGYVEFVGKICLSGK